MKRLVVTADDLGLHRGMTDGSIRAHRDGIVRACSISASGEELDHAVAAVLANPSLDAGIHFTLVEERPVLPPAEVPSLVTSAGRFLSGYREFAARHFLGRIDLDEVEAELRAQGERLRGSGLTLLHANGHQHMHLLPGIFERVLKVSGEFGIRYVRIADDILPAGALGVRATAVRALGLLASRARKKAIENGFRCNERTIGIADAGHLTVAAIAGLLDRVGGLCELVTHPATGSEVAGRYDWGYEWQAETEALCDPSLAEALRDRGIALTTIREVTAG